MCLSERAGAGGGGESAESRLKRLYMRSIRRGIKEMDIILGRFAEIGLQELGEADLAIYDTLLSENDHDLYRWVTGQAPAPAPLSPLIKRIAAIAQPGKT